MAYDDRKRLNGLQELRPLSIPHREEPPEEVIVVVEEEIPEVEELPPVPLSPLIIEFFPSEFETVTNGEITITAVAIDPDGDNTTLDFAFSAEAGTFSDQTFDIDATGQAVATVKWTAPEIIPEEPTEYKIDLVVTDEEGLTGFTGDDPLAQRPSLVIIVRFHCRPPDKPEPPTLALSLSTSMFVQWVAPNDNGCEIEDFDLRYRIRVGQDQTPNDWIDHDAGSDNDMWLPFEAIFGSYFTTISDLTQAIRHEFQIRATNLAGESEWSNSAFLIHEPPTVQIEANPTVIALSGSNNLPTRSTITVTATDAVDDSGDLTYEFTVFRGGVNIGDMDLTGTGLTRTFNHPGVNDDYEVTVTVTNSSNLSTTESVVVEAIDVPDKPNTPIASSPSSTSITVNWDEPNPNNSDITDYDLRYRIRVSPGETENAWIEHNASDTAWLPSDGSGGYEVTITGLTDVDDQEVQVRAANAAGESEWSNSGIVGDTAPTVQIEANPTLIALSGSNNLPTSSTITVTATDVVDDSDDLTYEFTVFRGNTDIGDMDLSGMGSTRVFSHPGVNTDYEVTVTVTNSRDLSTTERVTVEAIDVPDRPDTPSVSSDSSTSITVNWDEPETNNSDITDYDLRYRIRVDPGETENAWIEHNASDTAWLPSDGSGGYEVTITGLTDVDDQEVQVRAANAAGESKWSLLVTSITDPPDVTIEANPTLIALSGSNNLPTSSMITVTATDAVDDSDDLTYEFTVFRGNTNIGNMNLSGTGSTRVFSHPGVNADYEIQVTVTNTGNFSTTERASVRAIDAPNAPELPDVTLIDTSSIDVRWEEPASNHSSITDYDVRYKLISDVDDRYQEWMPDTNMVMNTFLSRQATITGLGNNASNYHVQVRAENEAGEGEWSSPASANGPPVITAFTGQIVGESATSTGPITINKDQEVSLTVTANDTDVPPDPLTYDFAVIQVNGVDKADDDTNVGSFRDTPLSNVRIYTPPSDRRPVTLTIQATVSDGLPEDGGLSDTATIDVIVENRLPTVSVAAVETDIHTDGGTDVSGTVTELDGDTLTYLWTVVDVNNAASTDNGTFSDNAVVSTRYNAPSRVGTFRVTLTVTETLPDGTTMNSVSDSIDITVAMQIRPPGKPNLISVVPTPGSHTALTVTWEAPSDNGGSDVIDYDIQYKKSTDVDFTSYTYTVTADTPDPIVDMLTGLDENTLYEVMVRARNASTINGGYSVFSDQLEASTTAQLTVTLTADKTTVNKGETVNIVANVNLTGVIYNDWTVSPDAGSFETPDSQHIRDWVAPYLSSLYQEEVNSDPDAYTITLSVTHLATNQTVEGSVVITVVNRPPRILSFVAQGITLGGATPIVAPGTEIPFTVQIVDDDIEGEAPAENINIEWSHDAGSGGDPNESYSMEIYRSVFRWTLPNAPGVYNLTMTADDNDYVVDNNGDTIESVVTRMVQVAVNSPPTISITGPTVGVDVNTAHLLTIAINDPDGDGTNDEINEEHISFITNEGGGSYLSIVSVDNQSELDELTMNRPIRIAKVTTAFDSWSVNDVLHYDGSSWSKIGTNDPTDNTPATLVRVSEGNYLRHWQAPSKKGTAVVEVQYQDYHRATLISTVSARASVTVNNQPPQLRIIPDDATITTVQSLQLIASPLDGNSQIDPDGDEVTFVWEIEGIGQLQFGDEIIEEGETISSGTNPQVIYIPPSPPDAPEAPTIEIVPTDGTMLIVSWTVPDNNGSEITDYDLRYKLSTQDDTHYLGVDIDLSDVTISDGTASYTVENLRSSHSYDFQVRAENISGESDWSPIGSGSTPNDPPDIDSFTTLDDDIEINGTTIVNVVASDSDDDELYYEYSIIGDPDDGTYGTIVADPDNEDSATYTAPDMAGIFEVQVQVFDAPADMRDDAVTYPTATLMITVADKPDAPAAPTVTVLANDTTISIPRSRIQVTWTAPDDNNSPITSYDVQYREDERTVYESVVLADDFTDTEVTITNLKPNTTYHVQVRAINSVSIDLGVGDWSPEGSGTTNDDVPNKPDKPTITVPEGETTELRADWTAPDDNGEAITDYDIQYRKDIDTTWTDWEADTISTDTFAIIDGLDENTRYTIRVRATNSVGDSEWSDQGFSTTGRTNLVPVISSFAAVNTVLTVFDHPILPDSTVLTVTATDEFTAVLDLTYTFSVPSGHGTIVQNTDIPFMATYTPPSTPGEYTITVEVSDGDDDLDQPTATITITAINIPNTPAAPTVTADPDDSTKLIVRWVEPNINFSPIIDYDVRYKKSTQSDSEYVEWNSDATTYLNTFATIEDLDGNTQYDVQVRASNIAGVSNWSAVTSQSTRNTPPQISSFISTPESLAVQGMSTLIVTASDGENDQLTFTFSLPHETMDDDHGTLTAISGETERYTYTAPNVTGTYTVRVVVSDGTFSVSRDLEIIVTDGRPPPPNAPTVETHAAGSILVRWSPPATFQGPPVTHYNLRYKLSTASSYTIFADMDGDAIDISGQFQIIGDLSNSTDYDVQVRAVNSAGASGWSNAGTGTTGAMGIVVPPQPPVISSITSPIHHTLTVTWIKPPIDDDPDTEDDITSYDVQYKKSDETDYIDVTLASDFTDLTTDITGLDANTLYDVRVQANNSAGASGYSDPTQAQTAVQIRPPDPPENLTVSENPDPTMLNASWSVPNLFGGTLVDYDVQYREAVDAGETENAWENWPATDTTDTNPSTTIQGLTADTLYDVRVRAQNNSTIDNGNGVGTSAWSAPVEGKTAEMMTIARVPDAPTITSPLPPSPGQDALSTSPTSITLSWSEPNDNGSEITGYYVQYKLVTSNTWVDLNRMASELLNRTATISNLSPNTRYNVRVFARNDVGDSPYSSESTIRTAAYVAPPAPSVTVGTITTSSIMVSWTAPSTSHTITGYRVQWKLFSEPVSSYRPWTRQMSGLSETVSNLSNNTRYNIRVAAVVGDATTTVVGAWGTIDATTLRINREPQILEFFASPTQITTNQRSTVTANASDADNDALSYDVEITHFNGTDITNSMTDYGSITQLTDDSSGRKRFRFTPPDRSGATGTYRLTLTVDDGTGESNATDTDTLNITVVQEPNNAPNVIVSGPTEAIENTDIDITATIRDSDDGDTWTGDWSANPDVGTLSFTSDSGDRTDNTSVVSYRTPLRSQATRVEVEFDAEDNHGAEDSDSIEIDILPTPTEPARVTGVAGSPVAGSHTSLEITWTKPNDNGATIDRYEVEYGSDSTEVMGEDTLNATLTGLSEGTSYRIRVRAHNSVGWGPYSLPINVSTTSPNTLPVVDIQVNGMSVSSVNVAQLATIRIDAVASDAEDDTSDLTFSWSRTGGTFLDFEDDRDYQEWRAPGTSGSYTVTVTVEDTDGGISSDSVTLVVPNSAPMITSLTNGRTLCGGSIVNIDVTASDSDTGDTLTYSWTYPGTGIVQLSGRRLRWTAPATAGDHDITVTVSDPEGLSDSETVTMTVNSLPTVSTSASETTVDRGDTVTITTIVTDTDDDYDDLTASITITGGAWVNFATTTDLGSGQTQVVRDWRAPNTKGDYTITLRWSDSCGSGQDSVTITVRNSPPNPTITPSTANVVVGQNRSFRVAHGDPDGVSDIQSYAWSISGSADGEISGSSTGSTVTVNYDNGTAGTDTLTCVVTDNDGDTGSADATITVVDRPLMPPSVTLSIGDSTLNPGQSTTLTARITNLEGGTVTYSATGGTITGTSNTSRVYTAPTNVVAGTTYTITVEVSNVDGDADDDVTVTINNVAPVITSFSGVPDTVVVDGSFDVTVNASDGNSDSLRYSWTPANLFSNATSRTATFDAPSRTSGSTARRTFSCRVGDVPPSPYITLSAVRSDSVIVVPSTPDAPRNLRSTSQGTASLVFRWDPPSDDGGAPITGYYAELYLGSTRVSTASGSGSARQVTWTGLSHNTTYRCQVRCDNEFTISGTTYGQTSVYESATATTDTLPAPTISLSIGDSTLNPGQSTTIRATVTNFTGTVSWSTTGGTLTGSGNSRTFEAPTNVVAGTTYTVTASVSNAGGSDSDDVTITINNVAPTVNITGVPATVSVGDSFRATADASDGNSDSLNYSWSVNRGTLSSTSIRAPSYTAPSRTGASTAQATLRVSVSDNPPSPYVDLSASDSDSVIIVPGTPGSPRNLSLSTSTTSTLAFTWDPPSSDGGAPITGYYAELYQGSTLVSTASGGGSSRRVTWRNLTHDTTYRCQVRCDNEFTIGGTTYGSTSAWTSQTGDTQDIPAPTVSVSAGDTTLNPNQTTTITASISNLGTGTVSWSTTGGTLTGTSNTSRTFRVPFNVLAGTTYTITVTATNDGGSGSDSVTITVNNVAPTVTLLGLPATMSVSDTTTVTANANDANADSLSYSWSANRGSFSSTTVRQPTYTAPSRTGASIAQATLTASVSDNPPSPYVDLSASDSDSVIITPNAPNAPLNFESDARTDTQLRFTWEAPTSDGGAPITGYYAELYEGSTRIRTVSGGASSRRVTWSNLTPNTTYRCQCRANNKFTFGGTEYGEDGAWAEDTDTTLTM